MQIDTRLTFIETITNVYQQEGLLGFFNGLVANHLKALVLPYLTKKFQDTRQTEFYKKNELYIFFFAMLIHEVIMWIKLYIFKVRWNKGCQYPYKGSDFQIHNELSHKNATGIQYGDIL